MALGGCSLGDSAPWLEEEWEVTTLLVLLLLKTCPSNTKAIYPLILGARRPRLRKGLLQQRRIVLRVSRNGKRWEGSKPSRGSFPPWSFLPMGVGEQPCQRFTQHLAISSPSTVFPTCGYRGGDTADNLYWRRPQRLMLATLGAVKPLTLPWH